MMTDRARSWRTGVTVALFVFVLVMGLAALNRAPNPRPVADPPLFWENFSGNAQLRLTVESAEALAGEQLRRGSAAVAARYYTLAALEAADLEQWLALAQLYRERADWAGMRECLSRVLDIDPGHAEAHYELALILLPFDLRTAYGHLAYTLDDPRFAERGQQLRQMLAEIELLEPAYQIARIGQALAALGYWPQAEQAFTTSVALEPDFPEAWAYLALVRAQQAKPISISIAQALLHTPEDGQVHFLVGVARRIQGNTAEALPALAYAQEREPANPAFALELGTLYRQVGDLPQAEYWLRYAVGVAGADASFLRMLALFYAEEQYTLEDTGLVTLREAVAELPQDADLQAAYAWALFSTGDSDGAHQALDAVFALNGDSPRGLYYLGRIYQMEGQREAARAAFERLLALEAPGGFDQLALRSLEQME